MVSRKKLRLNFFHGLALTSNRPFPFPPHTSNTSRASGWARGGRRGWKGCDGKSAYGQTKIFFLGFFAATALPALAILGLLTGLDRFQRVPVG